MCSLICRTAHWIFICFYRTDAKVVQKGTHYCKPEIFQQIENCVPWRDNMFFIESILSTAFNNQSFPLGSCLIWTYYVCYKTNILEVFSLVSGLQPYLANSMKECNVNITHNPLKMRNLFSTFGLNHSSWGFKLQLRWLLMSRRKENGSNATDYNLTLDSSCLL